jgi:hypothetical protein
MVVVMLLRNRILAALPVQPWRAASSTLAVAARAVAMRMTT